MTEEEEPCRSLCEPKASQSLDDNEMDSDAVWKHPPGPGGCVCVKRKDYNHSLLQVPSVLDSGTRGSES